MELQEMKFELRRFLGAEGRLTQYPSKFRVKKLSLFYLASKFEPGRSYTEREVNELLMKWHTFSDPCMLRRDLYDNRFLGREKDGSRYYMEEVQPTVEEVLKLS